MPRAAPPFTPLQVSQACSNVRGGAWFLQTLTGPDRSTRGRRARWERRLAGGNGGQPGTVLAAVPDTGKRGKAGAKGGGLAHMRNIAESETLPGVPTIKFFHLLFLTLCPNTV